MAVSRCATGACAAAMVALALSGQALAQNARPGGLSEGPSGGLAVTVFDSRLDPYTAYGRAEAGGAVIVFDQTPPGPRAAAPAPASPAPPPEPGPPIETAVGRTTPSQPDALEPAARQEEPMPQPREPGDPAAGKHYTEGVYALDPDYLLSYPLNAYRILSAPARFDRSDWIAAALVAGAGGALLLLDEPLMDFWRNEVKSGFTGDVSDVAQELGERTDILVGTTAAYLVAELLDSTGLVDARREKSAALLSLESFALTHGLVGGLKFLTGRGRPDDTDDAFDFQGPSKGDVNASFPSGHAGGAFAVASVLSEVYGYDNPWVPYVAYTLATGTALSRVDDNRHWFSDVFFSGAIGYVVGKTVTRYSPFLERNNITLVPFSRDDAQGLGLAYRF